MTRGQTISTNPALTDQARLDSLYADLDGRALPEAVAVAVAPLIRDLLNERERETFGAGLRIRRRDGVRRVYSGHYTYGNIFEAASADDVLDGYPSSMATAFSPVAPLDRSAQVLSSLTGFGNLQRGRPYNFDREPAALEALLVFARAQIGMAAGAADFKVDRLNRAARAAAGFEISRRRYDKLFRLTAALEALRAERAEQAALLRLTRFAKTGPAADLSRARFGADPASGAFVAYLTANLARRSLFTNGRQAGAFDERAAALFAALARRSETDWFAVAHVFPRADVLDRLSVAERVALLDLCLAVLNASAGRLEAAAAAGNINTTSMIVTRGNDSSTWNALAGAWNKARDYWIALVYSLGQAQLFEAFLPGKVLRLMAGDVAYWHRASGGDVHDDTPIWAALPRPWAVMAGTARCGRLEIEAACRDQGVDPTRTGWSAARPRTTVETARPTPETVHGVVIGHPALAAFLRRVDVFGGNGHPLRWARVPVAAAVLETDLATAAHQHSANVARISAALGARSYQNGFGLRAPSGDLDWPGDD